MKKIYSIILLLVLIFSFPTSTLAKKVKPVKAKIVKVKTVKPPSIIPQPKVLPLTVTPTPPPVSSPVISEEAPVSLAQNIEEFHHSEDFSYIRSGISGSGAAQSSLTSGYKYLGNLAVSGVKKAGSMALRYNLGIKLTDDQQMDPKNVALTNFSVSLSNNTHSLNLGDVFETFSQYSLGSALKGISYKLASSDTGLPETTLIYGLAYPRWDNFSDVKTIQRSALGFNTKKKVSDELSFGLSAVSVSDSNRVSSTDALSNGMNYAIDWEYDPFPGLTIKGESALSSSGLSTEEGAAEVKANGSAHRLEVVADADPSRVAIEYERVSPGFTTLLGSATSDREKIKTSWRYKHNKNTTLTLGNLWYHDNLEGQNSASNNYTRPEISLTLRNLFARQYSAATLSYKIDTRNNSISNTLEGYTNNYWTFNYRDRFGLFDSDNNLEYKTYNTGTSVRQDKEYRASSALSARQTIGQVILKPVLNLSGWYVKNDLTGSRDKFIEYSLGSGIDYPPLNITSNLKLGQNSLVKAVGDDSNKFFAVFNLYYRPACLAKGNTTISLKGAVNAFSYETTSNNFRETSISINLNTQF